MKLISKYKVIDNIKSIICRGGDAQDILKMVNQMRSLQESCAEKVGQWIKLDNCSNSGYYCSECHKRVVKEGWSDTVKIIKYCPNCGAKMASPTGAERKE